MARVEPDGSRLPLSGPLADVSRAGGQDLPSSAYAGVSGFQASRLEAFAELGMARLELTCGPDNEASQRVADRCGFVREGLLRSHVSFKGVRRDSVIYSLLSDELR
jgi:hypothetical protein